MKIALTGAGGFTGRHFVRAANDAGHEIVPITADLSDSASLRDQLEQCNADAILHLAGLAFVGNADARSFYDVNLFGTLNLLDAVTLTSRAPRRLVLASSANVYGNLRGGQISETQCPAPVNHYANSKLVMEHMARTYADRLSLIVARPFNYTGPGQSLSFLIPKLVRHFAARADHIRLGNLHVQREYNDVRFVCECYLRLLAVDDTPSTVNICTGSTWNLQSVISILESITGHTLRIEVDPSLVRPNEVDRLCGNPEQLLASVGHVDMPTLEETLAWMLKCEQTSIYKQPE